ncbi:cytochrome P450 4C1-like [Helicoverpa zea]|uniref:cytochrome P450 4C1-like n=1 Tax=Helicoverpa zea TaxID=7113 RepID=UPI001F5695FB|nr:cytochrome P450 4C1-like [Helicoverpa zea]
MLLVVLLLLCTLVICAHLYFRYSHGGRLIYKIKGPKEMFLLGNLFDIFITPEQIFTQQIEWRKIYGSFWKLCSLSYRAVYLYKPEDLEVVLSSTKYLEKKMPYTFLFPWLREGLLTSAGEKWFHRRKMLTPAFHFLILKKFFATFCEHSEVLMKTIDKETDKDKTDVFPIISRATLGVICETSMGATNREDVESLTNTYFKPLHILAGTVLYRVTRLWLYTDFAFQLTKVAQVQKQMLETLRKFTTQIIQDRREFRKNNNITECYDCENDVYGKKTKPAMLDLLLDEEEKGRIDETGITEEVDTFMFEGHDTTATALTFMIMRLANEPDIQDSIAEEMKSIFGDSQRPPTLEDLSQMKYLECCIKESLRLYPSVHFISRYFTEDVQIGEHLVPYNTMCNINVFDIHRNPEIFPEPEKFVPERFLPENCISRHPYAYIPFSAGPRNCIGQKFAQMELKTMMSYLLRNFKLEPVTKPDELIYTSDLVLRTTHPIYVRFRHRNDITT